MKAVSRRFYKEIISCYGNIGILTFLKFHACVKVRVWPTPISLFSERGNSNNRFISVKGLPKDLVESSEIMFLCVILT